MIDVARACQDGLPLPDPRKCCFREKPRVASKCDAGFQHAVPEVLWNGRGRRGQNCTIYIKPPSAQGYWLMARFGEIHSRIRQMILRAELPWGESLPMRAMADHFGVSLIPLREAVRRLEGEGLLTLDHGNGFQILRQDGYALQHRYRCHRDIVRVALMQMSASNDLHPLRRWAVTPIDSGEPEYLALRTAQMFEAIAEAAHNVEYPPIISRLSDRLHAARLAEAELFAGLRGELDEFLEMARRASKSTIKKRLSNYHRVRIDRAFGISKVIFDSIPGVRRSISSR